MNPLTANLEDVYEIARGAGIKADIEAIATMWPRLRSIIPFRNALQVFITKDHFKLIVH